MKRLIDAAAAAVLLLAFSPVMAVVAVLIRFGLGSPVIFRQERPGLHGKPFHIYKFRSMSDARDGAGCLLPDEARLTRLGLWLRELSLDELPQLYNVLKGDMSLVGPRPLIMEYLPLYSEEQARRHQVRPGITGWAQVNGRNALKWSDRFALDVWYVDHQSLALDLRILWLTFLRVVSRQGVLSPGATPFGRFTGED